jgi:predicted ATP pyrophosphatase (TIGR00289 family)
LELSDLKDLIKNAIELFGIEGIVTGAVESVYQAQRVQKICSDLGLWCFNPLWQMDQIELLETLVRKKYNIIISAIAAYPLDESWLGRKLDSKMISELKALTGVNPAGEGGEFESLVLNAPMFKREIKIIESEKEYDNHAGVFIVKEADLR